MSKLLILISLTLALLALELNGALEGLDQAWFGALSTFLKSMDINDVHIVALSEDAEL